MEQKELTPNWEINQKLIYKVWKKEEFSFIESKSPPFERNYKIELRLLDNNIVEAYYPDSILNALKLNDLAIPYFSKVSQPQHNSIFYAIDEYFRIVEIKNLEELLKNISEAKTKLKNILPKDVFDEIDGDLYFIESSHDFAKKKILDDVEVIHEFYGADIYDGYFFDLEKNESVSKKVKEKLLSLIKLKLGKIDIFQTDFLNNELYQIELLKGKDTISTLNRNNFEAIKEVFVKHEFDMKNFKDITLNHQKFIYDRSDNILKSYVYHFMTDTPNMKKNMYHHIELIN